MGEAEPLGARMMSVGKRGRKALLPAVQCTISTNNWAPRQKGR